MSRVTRKDAEKVVQAIHKAFPAYVQDFAVVDGKADYDRMVPVTNPEYLPAILEDWDGKDYVIAWESGSPYDWVYLFPYGGIEEEFGGAIKDVSALLPKGLHVEPVNNCVIALYKD